MVGAWLTADEIILHIQEQINSLGADAFDSKRGHAQLYSGPPQEEVLDFIIGGGISNRSRAFKQAGATNAVLIDETPISQYLNTFLTLNVYDYFQSQPHLLPKQAADEADKVMRHVSRKFIETLWGKVSTAVCGASKERIFYKDEIPAFAETIPDLIAKLVKSADIATINDIPINKVRKLYKPNDYDDAFRLICLGELRSAWHRARVSRKPEDMRDYLERKEFYLVERGFSWQGTAKAIRPVYSMTPEDRLARKQSRIQEFVATSLTIATASIDDAVLPVSLPASNPTTTSAHPA